jgi:hypothetical protein
MASEMTGAPGDDVRFYCEDGVTVPASRLILSLHSRYFHDFLARQNPEDIRHLGLSLAFLFPRENSDVIRLAVDHISGVDVRVPPGLRARFDQVLEQWQVTLPRPRPQEQSVSSVEESPPPQQSPKRLRNGLPRPQVRRTQKKFQKSIDYGHEGERIASEL